MANRNLELLIGVARLLRPMLADLVFVGGSTTALLITDTAAAEVRPTYDVDAIAEIISYAEFEAFSQRLQHLGFAVDHSEGAPICRWAHGDFRLDVMPIDEKILGFSNRWYKPAMETAQTVRLANDLPIRVVTAPLFLGTKLEAFKGRGKNDYFASHDLEDVVAVIDGRPS
jgi:predicted nucleotidyltransferase